MATYTAGSNFSAASANLLSGVAVKMKTIDNVLPNNTTTLTNDGELILPVLANTKYALVACLQYDSAANADISIFFTGPSLSTINFTSFGLDLGVVAGVNSGIIVTAAGTGTASAGGTNVGQRQIMTPIGSVVTGASAGNVQLQFAQTTSQASATTLRAGSWIALLLSQ